MVIPVFPFCWSFSLLCRNGLMPPDIESSAGLPPSGAIAQPKCPASVQIENSLLQSRDGRRETDVSTRCEIPKRRCFETLLRSVIRNTHVT